MKKPNQTKVILNQALGLNTQERTVLLEQIADTSLRSQVETLLADQKQLQQFLQDNQTNQIQKTEHQNIKPGSLIKRIRIIKLLGQGGMGSVYLGFDEKLERQVAIKSIRPEHLRNPETQQRFVREAQILSKINHPSICQLYDYVETAQGDFLVLEYIEGKPLYQKPLSDRQKLNVLANLAEALAVAHQHGIVHRDLKPDNIMITETGDVKVLDFGIAQSLTKPETAKTNQTKASSSELTQQGSLVGTIRYMSPEQANGLSIETASDLYALGIIAQEIFTHKAAYPVMETNQLLSDVQQGRRQELKELPTPVKKLIEQLTQIDPNKRPTALSTAEQIKSVINAPKHKKNNLIKYASITAGLVLIFTLLWQWQRFDNQAIRNEQIKSYENEINDLLKQAEQIYVLPLHPIDDEINEIYNQANQLYETIELDKKLTTTDKQRLLGIILLESESFQTAIELLESSQAESDLLADAWIKLYIEKAAEFSDANGFEQAMNDPNLRENYLKPALNYINKAHLETGQKNPLFQAFVLSQTESLDSGLLVINEILAKEQWNKDAVNLKALMLSASMVDAQQKGNWEQAKALALQTAETYQKSIQMARSYPDNYANLCEVNLGLLTDAIQRNGEHVLMFAEQSITACENALTLLPESQYPKQLLSRVYMMKAQWQTGMGLSAHDAIAQARSWNQKSSAVDNLLSVSWNQALILATEAKQLMLSGKPVKTVLDESQKLFDYMLKVDTEYKPFIISDLLFVLMYQSQEMLRQNQNPAAVFKRAQLLFDEAILTPDLLVSEQRGLINNMAQVLFIELSQQLDRGENVMPLGQKLLAFLNRADNMLRKDPNQLINLANTHLLLAEHLRRQQQPLEEHLVAADGYIAQALTINSTDYGILLSQASLMTLKSYFNNQDYNQANAAFKQAIDIYPDNPYSQHAWAQGLLIQAQNSQTKSQQITATHMAQDKIKRALSVDPTNQLFLNTQTKLFEYAQSHAIDLVP